MSDRVINDFEKIQNLESQVKRQRVGHKLTNKELKEEKARYSVLASEYSLVLEELKALKGSKPLIHIARQKKEIVSLKKELKILEDARGADLYIWNCAEAEMKHEIETLKERVSNLNHTVLQQTMQNREIKKKVLKRHIPEEFHNLLEQLVGDSSYE